MSSAVLIGVDEYLSTLYRPDCDYVDGEVQERNLGQKDHSKLQTRLWHWFYTKRRSLRLEAFVEMRVRVSKTRLRIPDVCVVHLPEPDEQVFTTAPYICIEVLSPEDTFPRLQERIDDYLAMGVPNIWVLDPASQRGWSAPREGHFEALDQVMRTHDGNVSMPLNDLFVPLD